MRIIDYLIIAMYCASAVFYYLFPSKYAAVGWLAAGLFYFMLMKSFGQIDQVIALCKRLLELVKAQS